MRKCTAKKGEFSCTVWGSPWCKDCAKYKSVDIRPHYKNIEEALKVERPTDKIIKILSNKFAVVKCMYTDGTYEDRPHIMFIGKGTDVFSAGSLENMKDWCRRVEQYPPIKHTGWDLINPQTGRRYYKIVHDKQSKYKRLFRKLSKLI